MADKMTDEAALAAINYAAEVLTEYAIGKGLDKSKAAMGLDKARAHIAARLGGGEGGYEREVNETLDEVLAWFAGSKSDSYPRKLVESVKSLRAGFHTPPARLAATAVGVTEAAQAVVLADREYEDARQRWDSAMANEPLEMPDESFVEIADRFERALKAKLSAVTALEAALEASETGVEGNTSANQTKDSV